MPQSHGLIENSILSISGLPERCYRRNSNACSLLQDLRGNLRGKLREPEIGYSLRKVFEHLSFQFCLTKFFAFNVCFRFSYIGFSLCFSRERRSSQTRVNQEYCYGGDSGYEIRDLHNHR